MNAERILRSIYSPFDGLLKGKKMVKNTISAIALLCLVLTSQLWSVDYFVSVSGNDRNPGTYDQPFASIQRAQSVIRQHKEEAMSEPVHVFLREGVYYQSMPLIFKPEDGGDKEHPVTYQAWQGEQVVISGGQPVHNWKKEDDLLVSDLPENSYYFRRLFTIDENRTRARFPNDGKLILDGCVEKNPHNAFRFKKGDIPEQIHIDNINIVLHLVWVGAVVWIDSVDYTNNILYYAPKFTFPYKCGVDWAFPSYAKYHLENHFDFLDQPGEWFYNHKIKRLYYYPKKGETKDNLTVVIPQMDKVLELRGTPDAPVKYLNFKNLSFRHGDWNQTKNESSFHQAHKSTNDAIIHCEYAENNRFENCDISLGGAHGIYLNTGSRYNLVQQCHIHDLGGGGVYIGRYDAKACLRDKGPEMVKGNIVDNCLIHDLSDFWFGSIGIWLGTTSDNRITHNDISNNAYSGISLGWCWHSKPDNASSNNLIAYNHIHHIGEDIQRDMGGIYTLGDLDGSVIQGNVIHHIYPSANLDGGRNGYGIYLDEGASNVVVKENLVFNTMSSAFFHHKKGRNMRVENNIFGFSRNPLINRAHWAPPKEMNLTFKNNIMLTFNQQILYGSLTKETWNKTFTAEQNLFWDVVSHKDAIIVDTLTFSELNIEQTNIIADPGFMLPIPQFIG